MFWGLIMEPNQRYTQTVEKSFHVSMASLDAATAGDDIVQVMLYYDDCNYLLCSLKKSTHWQVPLDLNFQEGTKIAFTSNGRGHVHLTGYLIPEEDLDLDELEEDEEEEDEEAMGKLMAQQAKRKAQDSPKNVKNTKRLKAALKEEESSEEDDDDDDDEDENEIDDENAVNGEEIEGDEDDSDDVDEEDEEEGEEEEESEDEEEEIEVKPQQKKNKQKEQQQQQQQNRKQDKQKLANGKDAKQEQPKQQQKKGKGAAATDQKQQNNAQQAQKKKVVEGGVVVEEVKVGTGNVAKPGKFVSVYYVGRLQNGKKFDSTMQGDGFKFRLGKGEVIKGWDVGLAGMKIGGKRRITIPPKMAYGAAGSPPTIPGNSTLIFEVELKNVH